MKFLHSYYSTKKKKKFSTFW